MFLKYLIILKYMSCAMVQPLAIAYYIHISESDRKKHKT